MRSVCFSFVLLCHTNLVTLGSLQGRPPLRVTNVQAWILLSPVARTFTFTFCVIQPWNMIEIKQYSSRRASAVTLKILRTGSEDQRKGPNGHHCWSGHVQLPRARNWIIAGKEDSRHARTAPLPPSGMRESTSGARRGQGEDDSERFLWKVAVLQNWLRRSVAGRGTLDRQRLSSWSDGVTVWGHPPSTPN